MEGDRQRIYILRERKVIDKESLENGRAPPVVINCVFPITALSAALLNYLSVCITAKNPQYSYTDRGKASQFMMTGVPMLL